MNRFHHEATHWPRLFSVPKISDTACWTAAALLSYAAAYWYVSRVMGLGSESTEDWRLGTVIFVPLYTAAVGLTARAAHRRALPQTAACWLLWLAQSLTLLHRGPHVDGLGIWQTAAWHMLAVYFVLCRTGMLAAGHAGCLTPLDFLAGFLTLPFGNFLLRLRVMWTALRAAWNRLTCRRGSRRLPEIAVSAAAALLLGAAACMALAQADENFARLWGGVWSRIGAWLTDSRTLAQPLIAVLSLPVGAWLFGLAGGAARRTEPPLPEETAYRRLGALPRLPALTGTLVLLVLCGVYALFFAVQAAEFAAALGAPLPLTAPGAAQFAVSGFWELCRVMLLNLAVLTALHLLGAKPITQKGHTRALAAALCGFGAAFAVLAGAKLAVYIALYGPTVRRIQAGWIAAMLLLTCILAGTRLFFRIPAARAVLTAAGISFVVLCALPLERFCVREHLKRCAVTQDYDWGMLSCYAQNDPELSAEIERQAGRAPTETAEWIWTDTPS